MEFKLEEVWERGQQKCVVCLSPVERDKASLCDYCWKQTVAGRLPQRTPARPFTLEDLRNIQEEMRQVPPLTPEQEARVREQLKGKKPGDYVECDLFIGIMPDFDKLDEQWEKEGK